MDPVLRSLPLPAPLSQALDELGFSTLTPIQAASLPPLLEGRDLIGQSRTGSGKTLAFALPVLARLRLSPRALQALVLCPTRELSAQVARELRRIGRHLPGLQVLVLAGGAPLRPQASALERGTHVVVGTPGRVLDHLRRDTLRLDDVATVVLDEADRMLDMGFADDMDAILDALPERRQTVLFSATFPPTMEAMSRRFQRNPARVSMEDAPSEVPAIRQCLLLVSDPADKPKALRRVLAEHPHESALVFANQKATVAELDAAMRGAGVSVASLHGDLEQYERDLVLAKFRNASTRVLIATDVAARGLDVDHLDLVINYDLPVQPDIYVHRIGRTGRAGKVGVAVSLASAREKPKVQAIEARTGTRLERLGAPAQVEPTDAPEPEASPLARDARMDTLRIAGGRKQKMRPGDILGALTGEAGGLRGEDIGKIEIHENFSYVAVAKEVARAAQKSLSSGRIKGKRFVVVLVK